MVSRQSMLEEVYILKPEVVANGTAVKSLAVMKNKRAELRARRAKLVTDGTARAEAGMLDLAIAELGVLMVEVLYLFNDDEKLAFVGEVAKSHGMLRARYAELKDKREALLTRCQADCERLTSSGVPPLELEIEKLKARMLAEHDQIMAEFKVLSEHLEMINDDVNLIVVAFGDEAKIAKLVKPYPLTGRA